MVQKIITPIFRLGSFICGIDSSIRWEFDYIKGLREKTYDQVVGRKL